MYTFKCASQTVFENLDDRKCLELQIITSPNYGSTCPMGRINLPHSRGKLSHFQYKIRKLLTSMSEVVHGR